VIGLAQAPVFCYSIIAGEKQRGRFTRRAGHAENHRLAQRLFSQDLPVIPLFLTTRLTITRPDLCGYRNDPTADSDTWNIEEFDFGCK
jgi:hypothetical protein